MRRTHLKRIERWFEEFRQPPVNAISGMRDHYALLWIKPWYGLKKKNPPLPVFQKMLDAFSRMYDLWDQAFKEAGEPYDLQLWVYDEHMIESQLVCAGVEKPGDRRTDYFHDCPEQYKFQYEKYKKGADFNPADFEWTTYEVRDYLYERTDGLSPREIRKLISAGWHEETAFPDTDKEEQCFWSIDDFVWVGRKK